MDPNSLIIGLAVAFVVWMFLRRRRTRQAGAGKGGAPRQAAKPSTMPRLGTPGTLTFNQKQALKRNHFVPDPTWSREEAALVLDAVTYLRAVCRTVATDADGPPPLEVQNKLLRIVLTTEDVRDYVRRWGESRRAAGLDEFADDEPELPRNNQFERVAKEARKYLAPEKVGDTDERRAAGRG